MHFQRLVAFMTIALPLAGVACGGTTQFAGAQPVTIAATPLPPLPAPPLPPAPIPEPVKPPPRVELRDNKIDFKEKIQFEVNKAIIKPESASLLHDIADVIKANPQVKKISIEGHASAEGNAATNKKLSDDRAKAVMAYEIKKEGVDAARLSAKGWGSEKPLVPNDTEEGREKNRRVDFLVMEQDVTQKKIEIDPMTGKERVIDEKKETQTAPAPAATPGSTPVTQGTKPDAKAEKKADPKAEPKKAMPKPPTPTPPVDPTKAGGKK
jgi:outer membrane protein OmpA-like peptidoglycan-associated protein